MQKAVSLLKLSAEVISNKFWQAAGLPSNAGSGPLVP